jgi:hypothetical protein
MIGLLRRELRGTVAFDAFYQRLIKLMPLKNVTSRFALENKIRNRFSNQRLKWGVLRRVMGLSVG